MRPHAQRAYDGLLHLALSPEDLVPAIGLLMLGWGLRLVPKSESATELTRL